MSIFFANAQQTCTGEGVASCPPMFLARLYWGERGILPAHVFSKTSTGECVASCPPMINVKCLMLVVGTFFYGRARCRALPVQACHIISLLSFNFTEEHTISRSKQYVSAETSSQSSKAVPSRTKNLAQTSDGPPTL